jgi:multiple sugar transport system substrate-binding protein
MHRQRLYLSLLCVALFLSACGPAGLGLAPTPEPAKIVLAVPDDYNEFYTAQVAAFTKANPKVQVEIINDRFSSTPPDVSVINWLDTYSRGGDRLAQALDLTPFMENNQAVDRGDFYPGLLDAFSRDGKLRGLPSGLDPFVMFYNQDLFDQYRVGYPQNGWTWQDFKTMAMQLRDPGKKIYAYATSQDYIDSLFFVYQHGGQLVDSAQKPQLNSREAVEAIEWYASLYQEDLAPTETKASMDFGGGGNSTAGIIQGQVAMWVGSVSDIKGQNGKGFPFRVGLVPLPRDVTSFTVSQMTGLVISAKTESPQTCWELVHFLNDHPVPWMVPARKSLANSQTFMTTLGKEPADAALAAVQGSNWISNFDFRTLNSVIEVFTTAVKSTLDGSASPDQALQAAQDQIVLK